MSGSSWFSRIFQGSAQEERERSDALPTGYPGAVLRRHRVDGDLIADPALVWEGAPGQGLLAHLLAEPGARFADVLIVLSAPDYLRATAAEGVPWLERLRKALQDAYQGLCRRDPEFPPERRMHVRLLRDGAPELRRFGLERGELLTGLFPQVYAGSSSRSREEVVIHLHLPGVFQGYRKVGRLFDDQLAFTLGNHWLDTFSHPALAEPALYQLTREPDGSLQHGLREELRDRFRVRAEQQQGVSVLTVLQGDTPLAHLVLEAAGKDPEELDLRAEALSRMRLSIEPAQLRARLEAAEGAVRAEAERRPNAPIEQVTLFADRAVVTRVRTVELVAGENEVRFEGLLPSLSDEGLEAELRAGRGRVVDVRTQSTAELDTRARGVLLREARSIEQAIEELSLRIQGLLRSRAQLSRALMRPGGAEEDEGSVTAVRSRLEHLHHSERELDAAVERECARAASLDDRLVPLLRELDRPASAGQTAVVRVNARAAGPAELALRYPVRGARWTPEYLARAWSTSGQLELELLARVTQSTGEPWSGVRLALSSRPDLRRSDAPAPTPWVLRPGPELAELLQERPEGRLTSVFGESEDTDLLTVPEPVSLDEGGEALVRVHLERAPFQLSHRVVPRLDPHVYRVALTPERAGPRLPEGPVSCTFDEAYAGSARLDELRPGLPLRLGFGVERGLRVQRVLVDRRRADEPDGRARHTFHYRTYLTSQLPEPTGVEVVEQIPSTTDLTLELATSSQGPIAEANDRDGTLTWRIEARPGEAAMIDVRFSLGLGRG